MGKIKAIVLAGSYLDQPWPGYGYYPENLKELEKYSQNGVDIKYVALSQKTLYYSSSLNALAYFLSENLGAQFKELEILGMSPEEKQDLEYFMSERIWKSSGSFRPRSRSWRPWEQ
ncbi:MAG: hypothetical protein DRP12_03810 [Candidatus Aenigmatarchaeota archaeon]|nr:MAG: hypothetical protein DRP12_03810 [Candidatus Aenigmarchaeota archaeon]